MPEYPLKLELRIDWSEIDLFGHINNVAIFRYIQAARVQCLEEVGLMQSQAASGLGPILASTTCRFRKPLFYPGNVMVHSAIDQINNSSFRIGHILCKSDGEIAAEAQDIIVVFDFLKQEKVLIADDLRNKLKSLRLPLL